MTWVDLGHLDAVTLQWIRSIMSTSQFSQTPPASPLSTSWQDRTHKFDIDEPTIAETEALSCKQALNNLIIIPPQLIDIIILIAYGDISKKITICAKSVYKGGSDEYKLKIHPFMNGNEIINQFEKWNVVENWYKNRDWSLQLISKMMPKNTNNTKNTQNKPLQIKNNKEIIFTIDKQTSSKDIKNILFHGCYFLIMRPKGVNFYIKTLLGKTIVVVVDSYNATVLEIMKQIEKEIDVPTDQQRLIFSGKQLDPKREIHEYNVERNCTFHLVFKLRDKYNSG